MSLSEKIKKDFINAFKSSQKERKSILGVVKSEIESEEKETGKNLSDSDVIKKIKKTAKGVKESLDYAKREGSDYSSLEFELNVLEEYLPEQMGESEIEKEVDRLIENGCNNIGSIMREFAGKEVDRKLVKQIADSKLKQK